MPAAALVRLRESDKKLACCREMRLQSWLQKVKLMLRARGAKDGSRRSLNLDLAGSRVVDMIKLWIHVPVTPGILVLLNAKFEKTFAPQ